LLYSTAPSPTQVGRSKKNKVNLQCLDRRLRDPFRLPFVRAAIVPRVCEDL
jgi:hypothetical protein